MFLSEAGAEFIANFEGFRADPYWDVDHYSIGYGTRARKTEGPITRAEGLRRLRHQVDTIYGHAVNGVGVKLNQNQFDALVSLTYNLGPGVLEWGIGKKLRAGEWQEAADYFLRYDEADGKVLAGLTRRRREERELFLKRPPVGYTDEERWLLKVLKNPEASKTRHNRAAASLRKQAHEIQTRARAVDDGWKLHDRGRRYQGIRRALRRYA